MLWEASKGCAWQLLGLCRHRSPLGGPRSVLRRGVSPAQAARAVQDEAPKPALRPPIIQDGATCAFVDHTLRAVAAAALHGRRPAGAAAAVSGLAAGPAIPAYPAAHDSGRAPLHRCI